MSALFNPTTVRALTGITKHQLTYWAKSGMVDPQARSEGGHARYTLEDVRRLQLIRALIEAGLSTSRIRKILPALYELLDPHLAESFVTRFGAHYAGQNVGEMADSATLRSVDATPE